LGESSEMSGESSSRTDIGIPAIQQRLLAELLKTGKPVVLVLFTGRPITLTWEQEHVPAILNAWFGGTETGKAVADVQFGEVNPAGKLPATFRRHVCLVPLYYSHPNTGRPLGDVQWLEKFRSNYLDVPNEPLYPFGYGLSYTTFTYGRMTLSSDSLQSSGSLEVSVDVRNAGEYVGEEVVQLYIRDVVGSVTRPVKELKGFRKIKLEPGQSERVTFQLTVDDLKFYNTHLDFVAEPGEFVVYVGTNSRDTQEARFVLAD